MSFGAQNVKLAMGAGKGGAISGAAICRSGAGDDHRLPRRAERDGLPARGAVGWLGGRFAAVALHLCAAELALLGGLAPVLRPVFRSGRAFAIERSTLLATPSAVNSVSAP